MVRQRGIGRRITQIALEILKSSPAGIRYSELAREIKNKDNLLNINTIRGTIWNLDQKEDNVEKISRGVYSLKQIEETEDLLDKHNLQEISSEDPKEKDFYQPFADWIMKDIEDATKAIPLGGNKFKDKWGTPDVIGICKSKKSDIIQMPIEIISAEIKTDPTQLITAFGQSCAYCLFSHKSYLVVPNDAVDISRLDSLCQVFGIGLVLFDSENPEEPNFSLRVRPHKQDPDMFYVNKNIKCIEDELFE